MIRLLEDFGDRENVTSAAMSNISSGGWSGPEEAFYEKKRKPVKLLLEHPNSKVRRWAKAALRKIEAWIEQARNNDARSQARFWK